MKKKSYKYNRCPECDGKSAKKKGKTVIYYKNTYVRYTQIYYKCRKCGTCFVTPDMNNINLYNARKAYEKEG